MNWEAVGAVAESVGLITIIVTLFYLAKQTRLTVELTRGQETRSLINQFNTYLRLMTEPENLEPMREALVSYRSMGADGQARAFVIFVQWVNLYEQCLYALEAGLLQQAVLDALQAYVLGFLVTPGGREFWEDHRHVFGSEVSDRLDGLIRDSERLPPPITETYPWLLPIEEAT